MLKTVKIQKTSGKHWRRLFRRKTSPAFHFYRLAFLRRYPNSTIFVLIFYPFLEPWKKVAHPLKNFVWRKPILPSRKVNSIFTLNYVSKNFVDKLNALKCKKLAENIKKYFTWLPERCRIITSWTKLNGWERCSTAQIRITWWSV